MCRNGAQCTVHTTFIIVLMKTSYIFKIIIIMDSLFFVQNSHFSICPSLFSLSILSFSISPIYIAHLLKQLPKHCHLSYAMIFFSTPPPHPSTLFSRLLAMAVSLSSSSALIPQNKSITWSDCHHSSLSYAMFVMIFILLIPSALYSLGFW